MSDNIIRNYKDTVFRMIFKEKKELLELYNAINRTNYDNPEHLEIVTLENAIYMNMKNDVSCLLDMHLQLYEQQTTVNPNMPIRFFKYLAKEFEQLLVGQDLYSSKPIALPKPKCIVFYNGTQEQPERRIYRLSDLFSPKDMEEDDLLFELEALQLNINKGFNEDLMERCPTLFQYMQYVNRVRKYQKTMSLKDAVNRAVDECIKEGILREFLLKNKAGVIEMSIFEYDEELHMKTVHQEGYESGYENGYENGRNLERANFIKNMYNSGIEPEKIAEIVNVDLEEVQTIISKE